MFKLLQNLITKTSNGIKQYVSRRKNKQKKHKHTLKSVRKSYMEGTNQYIDGKEIRKKVYRYDDVCEECNQIVNYGMTHEDRW